MNRRIQLVTQWFLGLFLVVGTSTAHAQYLAERLVPPQQVSVPALPMTGEPAEPRAFGAEQERRHLWALPFGIFPGAAISLTTEQRPGNWKRPVLDIPSLASESEPTTPTTPVQPVALRAYVSSQNPWQPPILARFPLPNEPLTRPDEDPSAASAFSFLTVAVPLATPNSAPLLRMAIADPFEQIRIVRLANPPADLDDPVAGQDRPALPKLPMVEPPK